eukprot:11029969-Ditylum_brightwellii.AAC.1
MDGSYTKKVLSCLVKSKMCKICNLWVSKELPAPVHVCVNNCKGSSKGMEAQTALELTIQAKCQHRFIVGFIVADDGSSMRAILKNSYKHLSAMMPGFVWTHTTPKEDGRLGAKLQDTGKLPLDVPQPKWLADPTHQTKGKGSSSISKVNCLYLKKYWEYMLKQNRGKIIEEMLQAAKAPMYHLLNKHGFCGAWCKCMTITLEQREKEQQYYCDVNKDAAFIGC